jgi:organic radical activating enzyme
MSILQDWKEHQPNHPYYSCEYIESGVAFNVESVNACCVLQQNLGWPLLANFEGGSFPLKTIMQNKQCIVQLNQERAYPHCENCSRLMKKKWKPRSCLFDTFIIANFRYCNIRCKYCSIAQETANTKKPYTLMPILEDLLNSELAAPEGHVHWGGGEPTVFKEFNPLIDLFSAYSYHHVIYTNCVIFSPRIETLLRTKQAKVICSVDSGSRKVYHLIKQRDHFEQVWTNIKRYAETDGHIELKFLVTEDNYHDINAFIERVLSIGVNKVICDLDCNLTSIPPPIVNAIQSLLQSCQHHALNVSLGTYATQMLRESRGENLKSMLKSTNQRVTTG